MHTIQCYLVMLIGLSINFALAQPAAGQSALAHLTSSVSANRQTVFTVHLLARLVDPGKKPAFAV